MCTKHQVLIIKAECASFDAVLGGSCRHTAGSSKTQTCGHVPPESLRGQNNFGRYRPVYGQMDHEWGTRRRVVLGICTFRKSHVRFYQAFCSTKKDETKPKEVETEASKSPDEE